MSVNEEKAESYHSNNSNNYKRKKSYSDEDHYKKPNFKNDIYFANYPNNTTEEELVQFFSKYGNVVELTIKKDENGKPLGYGFVKYSNSSEGEQAIANANDTDFNGKNIIVNFSNKSKLDNRNKYPRRDNFYKKNHDDYRKRTYDNYDKYYNKKKYE